MKNLKFWSLLMALVFGLSFGVTSCGDDDEDGGSTPTDKTYVEKDVIANGQSFYQNCEKALSKESTAADITAATASVVLYGQEYYNNRTNVEWTTNFLAGVAMEKYGITDAALAKSDEYQQKVSVVKNVLNEGFTADNVSNVLASLATFIASK